MKKIVLVILGMLTLCSYAQKGVVEFQLKDFRSVSSSFLCVFFDDGCGKCREISYTGESRLYDVCVSKSYGSTIEEITIFDPSSNQPCGTVYCSYDLASFYGKTCSVFGGKLIPVDSWDRKMADYGMSIQSSQSSIGGLVIGAVAIGALVAIVDALTDNSSNGNKASSSRYTSSSSSSKSDPCWDNNIPGSDKVWLSEADFSQIKDYWGNSMTELTIKFHNDNNWPIKVTYQVVYKNEKSSDDPDMRWIVLYEDDKTTTQVICGNPGKVVECIKLRKIEPAR